MSENNVGNGAGPAGPRASLGREEGSGTIRNSGAASEEAKAISKTADTTTPANPQIASLIPIAHKVLNTLGSLGLAGTRAQDAKDRASDVINKLATGKKFQSADELAAILKKGNAHAQAFAVRIVDVLQLQLPGVVDLPQPAEPTQDGSVVVATACTCASLEHSRGCGNTVADAEIGRSLNGEGMASAGLFMSGLADVPTGTLLDEQALANSLHVSSRTLRRMVGRSQLPPGVKLGGRRIWLAGKVLDFLATEADKLTAAARRIACRRSEMGG